MANSVAWLTNSHCQPLSFLPGTTMVAEKLHPVGLLLSFQVTDIYQLFAVNQAQRILQRTRQSSYSYSCYSLMGGEIDNKQKDKNIVGWEVMGLGGDEYEEENQSTVKDCRCGKGNMMLL